MKKRQEKKEQVSVDQMIRNAMNATLGAIQRGIARIGDSYDGKRNIYDAAGWPTDVRFEQYMNLYSRQGIATAVISKLVDNCWNAMPTPTIDGERDNPVSKRWNQMSTELNLMRELWRADTMSMIGKYSCLLLGFSDTNTVDDYKLPARQGSQLAYITPLAEIQCTVGTIETNASSPRFGKPLYYKVKIGGNGEMGDVDGPTTPSINLIVHYSRIVHYVVRPLLSTVYGEPYLKPIVNNLMDVDKVLGASGETYYRGARPGYQAKIDPNYMIDEAAKLNAKKQVTEYESGFRRFFMWDGITLEALEQQLADPKSPMHSNLEVIAGYTGIPKRVLIGSEVGELASSQDAKAYLQLIDRRRSLYCQDVILKNLYNHLSSIGYMPKTPWDKIVWEWKDIYQTSTADKAKVDYQKMQMFALWGSNLEAQRNMPVEVLFREFMGMSPSAIKECEEWRADEEKQEEMFNDMLEEEDTNIPGGSGGNPEDDKAPQI